MSHGLRFGCLAMTPTRSRQEWLDQARQTEERGFSTLQVSDHFVRTPLAPLVALSAAAQVTSTIRLGTLVLDNDFRHPAVLAKEISTLDQLSDGRVELGLGAGWLDEDYEVSGITMDSPGARINRLAEAVQVLRGAFTGDAVSTKGTHYRADGLRAVPHPVQRPAPPLLLGGGGPRVLRLAARHADIVGINLLNAEGHTGPGSARSAYEDAIDEKVAVVRAAATEAGRDPQLHVIAYWAEVTDEPESAIRHPTQDRPTRHPRHAQAARALPALPHRPAGLPHGSDRGATRAVGLLLLHALRPRCAVVRTLGLSAGRELT